MIVPRIFCLAWLPLAAATLFEQADLFRQGEGGVHTYRIPALVETKSGVLIAIADGRHDGAGDLPGRISLVMRRSFDKGRTWAPPATIRRVAEGGAGDPSLLLDRTNGRVWCFHAYGAPGVGFGTPTAAALQVNAMYSDNDGETWSAPVDLSPQFRDPSWKGMFATSGTNIQLTTGRLIVPLVVRDARGVIASRNLYSDDHGKSWRAGSAAGDNTDESHAVELPDGTVLQNMRNGKTRAIARSKDGGVTFGETTHDDALIDPSCNAGIVRLGDAVLFTNAASTKRERLTIRMSRDNARSWPVSRVIHAGPAAYSTVIALGDGTIGVLYERGERHAVERITFARFNLEWLTASDAAFRMQVPTVRTGNRTLDTAYRIAIGDLAGNIAQYQSGLLDEPAPVLLAGLGYGTPWTRDASVNAWNGLPLIAPEVSRNTLLAVLERTPQGLRVAGGDQYWDAIVWATGAWYHYLFTGDRPFLALAHEAVTNSLAFYEDTEHDPADGLFRGPGWSDGIAAYPDEYAATGGESGINTWPRHNPDRKAPRGYGIPMKALSTNCLYYNAYRVRADMATELSLPDDNAARAKAARLRDAINSALWSPEQERYRFLTGPFGASDRQEALGNAYALLFGIADSTRAALVLRNQYVAPAGVPAVWPDFQRYHTEGSDAWSRHAGTVWPQIQGMWAHAAARKGNAAIFGHELMQLAAHAVRDRQFAELYHPVTGEIYGGMQERAGRGIVRWESQPRQSWAASAYLRMLFQGLAGIGVSREGVAIEPCVPGGLGEIEIRNLRIRDCDLVIRIRPGTGVPAKRFLPWSEFNRPILTVETGRG